VAHLVILCAARNEAFCWNEAFWLKEHIISTRAKHTAAPTFPLRTRGATNSRSQMWVMRRRDRLECIDAFYRVCRPLVLGHDGARPFGSR